jgi:hypothetical protein
MDHKFGHKILLNVIVFYYLVKYVIIFLFGNYYLINIEKDNTVFFYTKKINEHIIHNDNNMIKIQ